MRQYSREIMNMTNDINNYSGKLSEVQPIHCIKQNERNKTD